MYLEHIDFQIAFKKATTTTWSHESEPNPRRDLKPRLCISSPSHLADINTYGIAIPNHEGKAGCAAIVLSKNPLSKNPNSNWKKVLYMHARTSLPKYAIPIFVRVVQDSADMSTGNNKHLKVPFQAEGIDIESFGQRVVNGENHTLFWLKPGFEEYQLFVKDDLRDLENGRARL